MKRADVIRIALFSVLAGVLYVLFHLMGNAITVDAYSRSAFRWMVRFWYYSGGFGANYVQGWLIPVASLWFAWRLRREIAEAPKRVSLAGLAIVVLALLLHWIGVKSQQTRLSLIAFVILLWGIPFYLYGWPTARLLAFPCGFLLFCVPLNFFDALLFPARIAAIRLSVALLGGLGIEATSAGSSMHIGADPAPFDMADGSSSIQMVLAICAFAAALAYLTQTTWPKRILLFASAIPAALMGITARAFFVGIVSASLQPGAGRAVFNHASGIITFAVALSLVWIAGILMQKLTRQKWQAWTAHPISPSSS